MKPGNNEDWVKGSKFESVVDSFIRRNGDCGIRSVLISYASEFHDCFEFECVNDALIYIQCEWIDNPICLDSLPSAIIESVRDGINEYGVSVSAISNAVYRLLDSTPIDGNAAKMVVNYIWEAWACNELDFRQREDIAICSILAAYK